MTSDRLVNELINDNELTGVHSSLENFAPLIKIKVDSILAASEGFTPKLVGDLIKESGHRELAEEYEDTYGEEEAEMMGLDPTDCYVFEDAFNGVRAGYAAGCKTIMIPDMNQPTEEIKALAYGIYDSLLDALEALRKEA